MLKICEKIFHKKELGELKILNKKLSNKIRLKGIALTNCERELKKKEN